MQYWLGAILAPAPVLARELAVRCESKGHGAGPARALATTPSLRVARGRADMRTGLSVPLLATNIPCGNISSIRTLCDGYVLCPAEMKMRSRVLREIRFSSFWYLINAVFIGTVINGRSRLCLNAGGATKTCLRPSMRFGKAVLTYE